jgi:1,4-alpha-glucan branching enzyme
MTTETTECKAGMGAIPHAQGVAFRVWAPHASKVAVIGEFNDWSADATPMISEENGNWYVDVPDARIGQEYRFSLTCGDKVLSRIDPYAREVTNSIGNGVIHDTGFDWEGDEFQLPPWNEIVIYEMHIGTFNDEPGGAPGTFDDAIARFGHLKQLGVNVIQVMPAAEFAGIIPGAIIRHIFAVETTYGGPNGFKEFVKAAHRKGSALFLTSSTTTGPSDLDLGSSTAGARTISAASTSTTTGRARRRGNTRPDYGRGEVRQYIHDNAMMCSRISTSTDCGWT